MQFIMWVCVCACVYKCTFVYVCVCLHVCMFKVLRVMNPF